MISLLVAASLAWLSAFGAPSDGLQRSRLPADVDFVVHLDFDGFKKTELWQLASKDIGDELKLDGDLQDVRTRFGIDPLTDIRALTLYKVSSEEDPTVVLFSTSSKVDNALAALKGEAGYQRVLENGIEFHTWKHSDDGKEETVFAYVHSAGDERVVVLASNRASAVRAARVLRGEEKNHAQEGKLLTIAPAAGSFLYVAAAHIPHLAELSPASQVFGLAQGIQVDLGEAGGFLQAHMGLTTKSPEDALNVSNVIQGLVSLARLAGSQAGEALQILSGLRFGAKGSEVTVDFEFAVQRLMQILSSLDEDEDEAPAPVEAK